MRVNTLLFALLVLGLSDPAAAQPLGSFQWQLQPFCNVLTLNVTLLDGVYTLDGFDDQCGAARRAPAVGIATLSPDGTVSLGVTIVTTPFATPVHVDASISVDTLGGSWRDSLGHNGTALFAPSGGAGGPPRPSSISSVALGSITAGHLAPGAVGVAQIDPTQVQVRASGTCPVGQFLRGIEANGTVLCEPSNAAFAIQSDTRIDLAQSFTTILQLHVPAGLYVVTGAVSIHNFSFPKETLAVNCFLASPTQSSPSYSARIDPFDSATAQGASTTTVPLSMAAQLTSSGLLTLQCQTNNLSGQMAFAESRHLTAIRVGSLEVVPEP
jgi:hypothetical protein